MKFTDRAIAKLAAPPRGRKDYFRFDEGTPYLAIRVTKKSKRFYQFRKPLGAFPGLTTVKARAAVQIFAGKLAAGTDLREERAARKAKQDEEKAQQDEESAESAFTLGRFISEWEARASKSELRPSYVKATVSGLRRVYEELLDQPVASISPKQLEAGWEPIADAKPAAARAARMRVRTLYRWGVRTQRIGHDPTERTVLEAKPRKPRQVFLNGDEARKVWRAAATLRSPYGPAIKFLLATAVRLREATGARWSEFNADFSEWEIPADRMKVGEPHVVWLPPPVREMLAGLPRHAGSDLVFSADGKREVTGFSALKQKLDRALEGSGVGQFTFHDFRRTVTTWVVRAKVADSITADRLLAHTKMAAVSAVASVYQRYDFENERRSALEHWVAFLENADAKTSSGPPLPLPAPDPEPIEAYDTTSPVVIPGDFSRAMEHKDEVAARFICKTTGILTDPAVMRVNEQIWKCELAPAFKAKHSDNSYPTAFLTLAYRAAELALNGETVLKRGEIEAERDKWSEQARRRRDDAKRARAAAEEGRKMGREELAREAEVDALGLDREAILWDQMLQAFITTDDPRCVEYRPGDASHLSSRAKGVALALRPLTVEIFGSEHREWASIYANAATGGTTTRYQGRQRLQGEVVTLKRAAR